ncbi:MAG: radical SAM protein, partial [Planctomycetota bacterium]
MVDASILHSRHPRSFRENLYVYPVVSRRAGGISLGVNLGRDKQCNFRCVYCQVDRTRPCKAAPVDLDRLAMELEATAIEAKSGRLFAARTAPSSEAAETTTLPLQDIAFSGDGEPTAHPQFAQALEVAAAVRRRLKLFDVRLVVITNSTLLDQPRVRAALKTLHENDGVLWCKLDAGTESYHRRVARSPVPLSRIFANLLSASRSHAMIVQSLFMRMQGEPPQSAELEAYCQLLRELTSSGGRVELVQIHTVARVPAEPWVEP